MLRHIFVILATWRRAKRQGLQCGNCYTEGGGCVGRASLLKERQLHFFLHRFFKEKTRVAVNFIDALGSFMYNFGKVSQVGGFYMFHGLFCVRCNALEPLLYSVFVKSDHVGPGFC